MLVSPRMGRRGPSDDITGWKILEERRSQSSEVEEGKNIRVKITLDGNRTTFNLVKKNQKFYL
jgi:hypothetical protein